MNMGNGMDGPTDCDVAAVKSAYLKVAVRDAAVEARIIKLVVDEGEEPVEDDTPVIEPEKSPLLQPKR
jgi:hypothetical protein